MIRLERFLLSQPDTMVDHNYLLEDEIHVLRTGVYYKRKSALTRHRFVKTRVSTDEGCSLEIELIDNRGEWQIASTDLSRLEAWLDDHCELSEDSAFDVFRREGLRLALFGSVPQVPRRRLPDSRQGMAQLYEKYTDMDLQGHFDKDSPDRDRLDWIVGQVPTGTSVVDVGCNSGRFCAEFIQRGCRVAGVDLAPELVQRARGRGVDAHVAFAEHMPFHDSEFEVAVCAELLEHVLDPGLVLNEIDRVLKPGGKLVGTVPHGRGDWGHADIGFHDEHLRAYDPDALEQTLRSAGFQSVKMFEMTHGTSAPQTLVFSCLAGE